MFLPESGANLPLRRPAPVTKVVSNEYRRSPGVRAAKTEGDMSGQHQTSSQREFRAGRARRFLDRLREGARRRGRREHRRERHRPRARTPGGLIPALASGGRPGGRRGPVAGARGAQQRTASSASRSGVAPGAARERRPTATARFRAWPPPPRRDARKGIGPQSPGPRRLRFAALCAAFDRRAGLPSRDRCTVPARVGHSADRFAGGCFADGCFADGV
jgi:hypothetical protein